jgi:glycerol kinase
MILGLDISTSITGITLLDSEGEVVYNTSVDTRKYKNFFEKADKIETELKYLWRATKIDLLPKRIFIEQSLQSFRSGFSSAKTLSTLARFNGVVSWIIYKNWGVEPEYIAATSARKKAGITVPKGVKGKDAVIKYVIDNVPDVLIEYTKHNNPKPHCFDKADSWVIARAGWVICQNKEK